MLRLLRRVITKEGASLSGLIFLCFNSADAVFPVNALYKRKIIRRKYGACLDRWMDGTCQPVSIHQ